MMLPRWDIAVFALMLAVCLATVYAEETARYHKRSTDYPSLEELISSNAQNLAIQNTDGNFGRSQSGDNGCETSYSKNSGQCSFQMVLAQLLPAISMSSVTKNFLPPEKFNVESFKIDNCNGATHETVSFSVKSVESVEIQPQYLTMAAGSDLVIYWKYKEELTQKSLSVNLMGHTSIGGNTAVPIKLRKKTDREDYVITMDMATLSLNNFLGKFGIESDKLISETLSFERNRLSFPSININSPEIKGIFSAGEGFELTATGSIATPELPSDADKFYAIVQDFKKSAKEEGQTDAGFNKPIGGIFALYKKSQADVTDAVMSLTGLPMPELKIFKNVRELAITAASEDIIFINHPKLYDLTSKFVPAKGMTFMEKGLKIVHYTSNTNTDIKDEEGNMKEKIIFQCGVTSETLSWNTPEVIETTMQQVATMAFPDKSLTGIVLEPSTKVMYESIDLNRTTKEISVNFNLTEIVPVLENRLVTLLNATMSLKSASTGNRQYDDWVLAGKGKQVILEELIDITVEQSPARTTVSGPVGIYSIATIRERTHATYLDDDLASSFPFTQDFPLSQMHFEAAFERNNVLKLKGTVAVEKRADIEILYYMEESGPQLKLAMVFHKAYLHSIVNMIYGDDEKMESTWMRFEKIGIIMRKKKGNIEFDRPFFKDAEYFDGPTGRSGGIGILAQNFMLDDCSDDAKLCIFLRMHQSISNEINRIKYYGRITAKKLKMEGSTVTWMALHKNFHFGPGVRFKLTVGEKGDRNVMYAHVYFRNSQERYPAKINYDGNKLILDIGDKDSRSKLLMNLDYVVLDPVNSKYSIPVDRELKRVELKSRLYLGTVEDSKFYLNGGTGRQYIYFDTDKRLFIGHKSRLSISSIEDAFGISGSPEKIRKAAFKDDVVVAYNSADEIWKVPDFNVKVKKGLHFYGKLFLNEEEEYDAIVSLTEERKLIAEIELPPLRYGRSKTDSEGKRSFKKINMFLSRRAGRQETGPTLFVTSQGQEIKGYCNTIGMQGEFISSYLHKPGGGVHLVIELNGKMYDEVEDAKIVLSAKGGGKPTDYSFTYEVDLTSQAQANLKQTFRDALADIKKQMTKGKETANSMQGDVEDQFNSHVQRKALYETQMERVQKEIFEANQDLDQNVLDISTDCTDKCRTVSMPGIEWKDECLPEPGDTKRTMKCLTWNENKEKVVNVICLLKCEAAKYSASGSGKSDLDNTKILLNKYKKTKTMAENEARFIAVLEEAKTVAEETIQLVEESMTFDSEIATLLQKPETEAMASIDRASVSEDINDPSPPCLRFHLVFTINAPGQVPHDGKYDVCFNGEFYQNLGIRMLRVAYPKINKMYKALEEAELRYAKIAGIKKSLDRVMKDIKKNVRAPSQNAAQRSEMDLPLKDPAERRLEKIAKRRLPKFTSMNDKTQMGFEHYSPWAVARRADLFYSMKAPEPRGVYNMSSMRDHSACNKVRKVVAHYKDVTNGLRTVSEHYQRGKTFYGNTKDQVTKDLQDTYSYLMMKRNSTKMSTVDKENMMYWFKYTEAGLKDYLETYTRQLADHNKRGLEYWRSDISAFFDKGRLFNELHQIGHQAYSRSNIQNKEAHVRSFNDVGQTIQQVLTQPDLTLEQAHLMVNNLDSQMKNLHKSTLTCE